MFEFLIVGAVVWSVVALVPALVGDNKASSSATSDASYALNTPVTRLKITDDDFVWVEKDRSEIIVMDLNSQKKDCVYLKRSLHLDHWTVSRDGKTFMSSTGERYFEIFRNQETIVSEELPGCVTILTELSSDGQTAVRITDGRNVRSWDLSSDSPTFTDFEIENRIEKIAVDPAGQRLAASRREGLEIYDLKKGEKIAWIPMSDFVFPLFSDDEQWLVLRSTQSLTVCDAQTFECRWRVKIDLPDAFDGLAISPDSKWIAAKTLNTGLRVFDSSTGECRHTLTTMDCSVPRIDFTSSADALCYSDDSGSVWVWTFADHRPKRFR
jgi:WD40 repeat protein